MNDTLGHAAGDELLKSVAERLLGAVREEDTVARLGGDEFMIALWHVNGTEDTGKVAEKLIAVVAEAYELEGRRVTVTISAGASIYPDHGEDADALMKSADVALYEAKRAGKNTFRIATAVSGSVSDTGSPSH